MRKFIFFILIITQFSQAQNDAEYQLGRVKKAELEMAFYPQDSTANALVLEEAADRYISKKYDYKFRIDYYYRIKLFNKKAFPLANIKIPLRYDKMEAHYIEAYSYHLENGVVKKNKLNKAQIFTNKKTENYSEIVFTIPNLKEGSVIEYKYSVITPYTYVDDWYFQSDIPKLKSDFKMSYVVNYKYKARLRGFLKLKRKNSKLEKKCIFYDGAGYGNCLNISFGMDSIPAFEEEDYMVSKQNYLSKLSMDLTSVRDLRGVVKKYTNTWEHVDKTFRTDYIDNQTTKKSFFEKNLPQRLLAEKDQLKKAKEIYTYIKNRFNWNEKYWKAERINVKRAYEAKTGSVDEINLSLYNSLQAANIESYIVLLATRDNGLPTKIYPVLQDFNYILVKVVIDNKSYFLDATNKFLTFGQVPKKCINGDVRVMDFVRGSYWDPISPSSNNSIKVFAQIGFDDENIKAKLRVVEKGYYALEKREYLSSASDDDYFSELSKGNSDFEVDSLTVKNKFVLEKPLEQSIELVSDFDSNDRILRINPFFYFKILVNPFKLKERNYPVDYGYTSTYTYTAYLDVPKGFKIKNKPEQMALSLPNNGAKFLLKVDDLNDKISFNYRFQIRKRIFSSQEYFYLKEFYKRIVKVFDSYVEFEKIQD